MNEVFLSTRSASCCRSALWTIPTVALLALAPSASAQTIAPAESTAEQDGAMSVNRDSEGDPISLEAIQEGVKTFELRQDDIVLPDATSVADTAKRRNSEPSRSDGSVANRFVPPFDRKPPRDALPHRGAEATVIQQRHLRGRCRRRKLARPPQQIILRAATRMFDRLMPITLDTREGQQHRRPGSTRAYARI